MFRRKSQCEARGTSEPPLGGVWVTANVPSDRSLRQSRVGSTMVCAVVTGMESMSGRMVLKSRQLLRSRGRQAGSVRICEFDPTARELRGNGITAKRLTPQEASVLALLVSNAPGVVCREVIESTVWSSTAPADSDQRINDLIQRLRAVLGDSPKNPEFIETVSGVGYRFVGTAGRPTEAALGEPATIQPASVLPTDRVTEIADLPLSPESGSPAPETLAPSSVQSTVEIVPADRVAKGRRSRLPWLLSALATRRIPLWLFGAVGVIIVVAAVWLIGSRTRNELPFRVSLRYRQAVGVLGFKNLANRTESAWLSTALTEMLRTELSMGRSLRTISGEEVARAKLDLSLPDTDSLSGDTLAVIRKNLAADIALLGSYAVVGQGSAAQVRLDIVVQNTATGETTVSLSRTGTQANLLDMVTEIGATLRN